MTGLLTAMGTVGTSLALLVLGHVLADFAFQTRWILANKHRLPGLGLHGAVVFAVHLVAYLPVISWSAVPVLLGVAVSHAAIDLVKTRLKRRTDRELAVLLGDQAAHGLVLLAAWTLLASRLPTEPLLLEAVALMTETPVTWTTTAALLVAAFTFAHHGGNAIVRAVLPADPSGPRSDDPVSGRLIGTLERYLVIVLALAGQWNAIVLVVAAKSIARFEDLKERPFAEYYLVGTLASVLVAVAVASTVQALV